MFQRTRSSLARCLVALVSLVAAGTARGETILFEDDFNSGTWKPEWVSKGPTQWVEDGVLNSQDLDGWPRDAMAVVHDGDTSWTDYTVALSAGFAPGTQWDHFNILLRTDDFLRNSENNTTGRAYQLEFFGTTGFGSPERPTPRIALHRFKDGVDEHLFEAYWPLTMDPMVDIVVSLVGNRIGLTIDGRPVIQVTDPDPLLYGGIGVHTIWEAHAQFDNVVVTPEPGSAALVATGLLALAGRRVRRSVSSWALRSVTRRTPRGALALASPVSCAATQPPDARWPRRNSSSAAAGIGRAIR